MDTLQRAKPIAYEIQKPKNKELTRFFLVREFAYHNRLERLLDHSIPKCPATKDIRPLEEALTLAQKKHDEWLIEKIELCKTYFEDNAMDRFIAIASEAHTYLTSK